MAQVARQFRGVVHRLEHVALCEGVTYVNNSMCTNIDAFERSLDAIGTRIAVIAGGVFKGDDAGPIARSVVAHNVSAVVLIGASARLLESAMRDAGYDRTIVAGSLVEAVTEARKLAQPGDTVMLAPACASFDMFLDFEDRGNQFKEAVRTLCRMS
jgi:UDP-N-acetylmuramoylalanine--D-glutamate ligase